MDCGFTSLLESYRAVTSSSRASSTSREASRFLASTCDVIESKSSGCRYVKRRSYACRDALKCMLNLDPLLLSSSFSPPLLFTRENLVNSEQFITFPAESEARICSYVSGPVLRSMLR